MYQQVSCGAQLLCMLYCPLTGTLLYLHMSACSRLVAERLLHFNLKLYQRVMPELRNVTRPNWENMVCCA